MFVGRLKTIFISIRNTYWFFIKLENYLLNDKLPALQLVVVDNELIQNAYCSLVYNKTEFFFYSELLFNGLCT